MKKIIKIIMKRKIVIPGILILFLVFFLGIFCNLISQYDPMAISASERLQPPSSNHWFGTDNFGRDILSRVIFGARLTIISGLGVVILATGLGLIIAVLSAYFPSFGSIMMRFIDILMAFPELILALALMSVLGRGLSNVIIAVSAVFLTRTVRIIYGLTLKTIQEDYIKAAISQGAPNIRIIIKHILPNLVSPLVVQITFTFAFSILRMASLDYLGLGVAPNIPSWGNMLNEGRDYIVRAPWLLIFPGLFIVLTALSFNIVGDLLRDQLDPRFRSQISGV